MVAVAVTMAAYAAATRPAGGVYSGWLSTYFTGLAVTFCYVLLCFVKHTGTKTKKKTKTNKKATMKGGMRRMGTRM